MTKFILTLALAFSAATAQAQPPADMLSRLVSLEDRVAALEVRSSQPAPAPGKLTYDQAYRRAVAENKPLVVWSGTAVCPPCVAQTAGEWVHFVGAVPGLPADGITVGLPDGAGGITDVGEITYWVGGDAYWGHVPSVRRAIAEWRSRRSAARPVAAGYAGYGTAPMFTPAFGGMGVPAFGGFFRGGSCATCR